MDRLFDRAPSRRDPDVLNKWTYYPEAEIAMWVADMDFRAPPAVLKALRQVLDHGVLGYELPSRTLRETVAVRMDRLYGWQVDPDWVVTLNGIVAAFHVAARTLCTGKRGYLIQTPAYNEFFELKDDLGVPELQAPLRPELRGNILQYGVDWDAFRKQVRKARMFLLCNPHNPVGIVYSRADLKRMAELCLEQDVIMVSDEIHSELLLGEQQFTPLATLSREIARHTITLIAPSKTFNIPGLACGFAIIPDPELRARYSRVVEQLRINENMLGLHAARAAFSGECDDWLAELRKYLTANRDFLVDFATKYLPDIRLTRPSATYLAWLDCREPVRQGRISGSPFEFFLKEAKVAFGEGKIYGKEGAEFVRLNFGCTRRTLTQALNRVRNSLYRRQRG